MLPTMKQSMKVRSDLQFHNLIGTSGNPISNLEAWPNVFIIHPSTFVDLEGTKRTTSYQTASLIIHSSLCEVEDNIDHEEDSAADDDDDDDKPIRELSISTEESYRVLIYIWVVGMGYYSQSVGLSEPPDTAGILDERQGDIQSELYTRGSTPASTTGSPCADVDSS